MLPKNKLGKQMFKKLKAYQGDDHPHASQEPQIWEPKLWAQQFIMQLEEEKPHLQESTFLKVKEKF